eukprot:136732_1
MFSFKSKKKKKSKNTNAGFTFCVSKRKNKRSSSCAGWDFQSQQKRRKLSRATNTNVISDTTDNSNNPINAQQCWNRFIKNSIRRNRQSIINNSKSNADLNINQTNDNYIFDEFDIN